MVIDILSDILKRDEKFAVYSKTPVINISSVVKFLLFINMKTYKNNTVHVWFHNMVIDILSEMKGDQ